MAEKVQDKKIQKTPPGKGSGGQSSGAPSGNPHKHGDRNPRSDSSSKPGDNKKKW